LQEKQQQQAWVQKDLENPSDTSTCDHQVQDGDTSDDGFVAESETEDQRKHQQLQKNKCQVCGEFDAFVLMLPHLLHGGGGPVPDVARLTKEEQKRLEYCHHGCLTSSCVSPARRLCSHWQKGRCRKGFDCDHRHTS